MNSTEVKSGRKQLKDWIKAKWRRLSDEEIDQIDGKFAPLVSQIQQRYGRARADAQQEVRDFIKACERSAMQSKKR